jgi:hypothetical protein
MSRNWSTYCIVPYLIYVAFQDMYSLVSSAKAVDHNLLTIESGSNNMKLLLGKKDGEKEEVLLPELAI